MAGKVTLSSSRRRSLSASVRPPSIEIGAGARIEQRIYPDPQELTFWQEKPADTSYINYVEAATAKEIIDAGKEDLTAGGEGFMRDLTVGTPTATQES